MMVPLQSAMELHQNPRLSLVQIGAPSFARGDSRSVDIAQAVRPLFECLRKRLAQWRLPEALSSQRTPRSKLWMPPPAHSFHEVVLRL